MLGHRLSCAIMCSTKAHVLPVFPLTHAFSQFPQLEWCKETAPCSPHLTSHAEESKSGRVSVPQHKDWWPKLAQTALGIPPMATRCLPGGDARDGCRNIPCCSCLLSKRVWVPVPPSIYDLGVFRLSYVGLPAAAKEVWPGEQSKQQDLHGTNSTNKTLT